MSLNQEVLDDLNDDTIVDNELIHTPNGDNKKDKVTIIPSDEKVVIPEEELKKLPDSDIQFNIVEEGVSKIIGLKEVESKILGQEAINQKGAEYINASFEGFLDNHNLKQFSIGLTKTNFESVRKFMAKKIANEEQQVVSGFNTLLEKMSTAIIKLSKKLEEDYYKDFYENLYSFNIETKNNKEAILSKKGTFILHEGQMVNYIHVNLMSSTVQILNLDLIKQCLESYALKSLIAECLKKDMVEINNCITLSDLICFFADDFIMSHIETEMKSITTNAEKLENIKEKYNDSSNVDSINEFLKENQSFALTCSKNLNIFCTVLNNAAILASAIKPSITFAKNI